jgi:TonB family protein
MTSESQTPDCQPAVDRFRVDLLPVVSLVLWLTCLIIGLVGNYVRLARPAKPVAAPKPTEATLVNVSLSKQSSVAEAPVDSPPPVADTPPIPDAPPAPQVVAISPAIAFAVPVQGPVQIVPRAMSPAPPKLASTVYKQITYGSGEGAQPKPEYPDEAALAGQEGTVVVRYRVAEDGSITSAEVSKPCPWPLLNQAAARSIRETWTYPAGSVRYYEISITYRSKPQ